MHKTVASKIQEQTLRIFFTFILTLLFFGSYYTIVPSNVIIDSIFTPVIALMYLVFHDEIKEDYTNATYGMWTSFHIIPWIILILFLLVYTYLIAYILEKLFRIVIKPLHLKRYK